MACKEPDEEKVILTALCGHGRFDMAADDAFLCGGMVDEEVSDERFAEPLTRLPQVRTDTPASRQPLPQ